MSPTRRSTIGDVGRQEGVPDAAHDREAGLETRLVQVVEEHAADAPGLVAVLQEEVVVAPALEPRVEVVAERLQGLAAGPVEMDGILLDTRSTASGPCPPPNHQTAAAPSAVAGATKNRTFMCTVGTMRIARVQDQRHAHGGRRASRQFRAAGRRSRRQACPGALPRTARRRVRRRLRPPARRTVRRRCQGRSLRRRCRRCRLRQPYRRDRAASGPAGSGHRPVLQVAGTIRCCSASR